ncbi:MAG: class B sortase [Oscillospiraceae bacterium]|nr:class B sortase [Oscillospiraceae bacterium]
MKNTQSAAGCGQKKRHRVVIGIAMVTTVCAVLLAFVVIPHLADLRAFRREQAGLPELSPFDSYWHEINPDYVGWLKIDGTAIDFPVVRADDNERYLDTTFRGDKNRLGAIFMDYRNTDEDSRHIIIYGHQANNTDGEWLLFGGLEDFIDEDYMTDHPVIMFMQNDSVAEYEIFSARKTDVNDPAYQIDFAGSDSFSRFAQKNGAHPDAEKIITLSTCIGADNDSRLIVQGVFKRTVPANLEYSDENGWEMTIDS